MTLQALLFDVDGTLADTERDGHRLAFNRAFTVAGLDWRWDVALYGELLAITGGKERMRHYVEQYRPDWPKPENPATAPGDVQEAQMPREAGTPGAAVALGGCSRRRSTSFVPEVVPPPSLESFSEIISRLHAAKTAHYTAMLAQGAIPLRPGVRRLLAEARTAKLRLAIATTTTPANVSALLRHTLGSDAESWFEVIGAGDAVSAKKPAPDIYYYVLERLGLPASDCLAFEDSENGVCAARARRPENRGHRERLHAHARLYRRRHRARPPGRSEPAV